MWLYGRQVRSYNTDGDNTHLHPKYDLDFVEKDEKKDPGEWLK
jgi:hypothetical protein